MKRKTKIALALAALSGIAAFGPASAGEKKPLGVVELFTSQGCSSCPPADAMLADLAKQGDVVALAYHVDYWDYLGWRDTLARSENTSRQQDYAKSFGGRSVYTPQAVLNGRTHVNGANRAAVIDAIEALGEEGKGLSVNVSMARSGDSVVIQTGDAAGPTTQAHLVLVYFNDTKDVKIERGENRGRTITYWNSVSAIQPAGMWHGKSARYEMPYSEVEKKGAGGCAALLQAVSDNGLPGPIIGAAIMKDDDS